MGCVKTSAGPGRGVCACRSPGAVHQSAKAKVRRLCVQLARNGRGVKGRRSRNWLEPLAEEGGMSAKFPLDFDSEVRKVTGMIRFVAASLVGAEKV